MAARRRLNVDEAVALVLASDDEDDLHEMYGSEEGESSSDEEMQEEQVVAEENIRRKVTVSKRLVHDLDSAMDERNYDAHILPRRTENMVATLQPGRQGHPPETISWTTAPPPFRGRQRRADVIRTRPGVSGREAKALFSERDVTIA